MIASESLTKFYIINKKTIVDRGLPWAKFILLPQNDPQQALLKKVLLIDPNIKNLITRLNDPIWGIRSLSHKPADYRVYGSFYWNLRFLADIGLTAEELRIVEPIKQLQLQQLENGQFMVCYHRKKQQTVSLICMTAHLSYCLIRMGYKESSTVETALRYILTTQRNDGGWHCDRLKQMGERDESDPSCSGANIHVIRFLGQYGKKYEAVVNPSIKQLEKVADQIALPECELNNQQNLNLCKLRYPPHYTGLDILNMIHSLSFFPDLLKNSNLNHLILPVLSRWDGKNCLRPEKGIPEWSAYDFGRTNNFSEWLSSLLLQAIERFYFKS